MKKDDKQIIKATKNNGADKEVENGNGKCNKSNKNNSFFDVMFDGLLDDLKEELGVAMLERHEERHESGDKSALRIDKILRIVDEACGFEELKEAKKDVKKEKCIEGEDKRIVNAKRKEERELVDASESESDTDSSDDELEEEHGDAFHKLFDGQLLCVLDLNCDML